MIRLIGSGPHPDCKQRFDHSITCDVCYPLFPRRIKRGTEFDLTRQATSAEISAMIIAGLADVGLNTAGFSGIKNLAIRWKRIGHNVHYLSGESSTGP
jgi:hypothetical protein